MTTPAKHTTTVVASIPDCDICGMDDVKTPAYADAATTRGGWAYMCEPHFKAYGIGLGLGKGQRLLLAGKSMGAQK